MISNHNSRGYLLAFCFWLTATMAPAENHSDRQAPVIARPASSLSPQTEHSRLIEEIRQLLDLLAEQNIPVIDQDTLRNQLFKAVLTGARLPAGLVAGDSNTESQVSPLPDEKQLIHQLELDGNLYIRIDRLSSWHLKQLNEILTSHDHGAIIIIDLRGARQSHYDLSSNFFDQIEIRQENLFLLINRATAGTAELLIEHLHKNSAAISIGSSTQGRPIPFRPHSLASGTIVHLPDSNYRKVVGKWPPQPIEPIIAVTGPIDPPCPEKLQAKEWRSLVRQDQPLQISLDLATMIKVFKPIPPDKPIPPEPEASEAENKYP